MAACASLGLSEVIWGFWTASSVRVSVAALAESDSTTSCSTRFSSSAVPRTSFLTSKAELASSKATVAFSLLVAVLLCGSTAAWTTLASFSEL